jgi:hypothetical protein
LAVALHPEPGTVVGFRAASLAPGPNAG